MKRQSITPDSELELQRQYIYLPRSIWHMLQSRARLNETSVSKLIENFAKSGDANSKDNNDANSTNDYAE